MKSKTLIVLVSITLLFGGYNNTSRRDAKALSVAEMSDLTAGDCCTITDQINNFAYSFACNVLNIPSACDMIKNCECEDPLPCTDPCPNGGYEEEYSTCQQLGGQIAGQSQCSIYPNRICCIEY